MTGYGIIEKHGSRLVFRAADAIRTSPRDSLPLRLRDIFMRIQVIIDEYTPDYFSIETAFYGKNVQSTLKLGHARGVAILAAVLRQLPIIEYSPREIKRAVTGNGAASKKQVAFMVRSLLNDSVHARSHDVTDALAIAICHAHHMTSPRAQFKDWKSYIHEHPERVKK